MTAVSGVRRSLPLRTSLALVLALSIAGGALPAARQQPDRSTPPVPGPASPLKLPAIAKRTLSNGLRVWIVEMREVPVVESRLLVHAGSAADPAGKFGLAHFTAAMLDEGAGSRDALELADAIAFLGASLGTSSSTDASIVRLHSLTSTLDDALALMADVVLRPTFPPEELDRLRQERLAALLQNRDDPSTLATLAFSRTLYGSTHRYGTATMGSEAANRAITVADLKAFHATHYQPRNAHLIVAGDVTAATLVPKLERAFGRWRNGRRAAVAALPDAEPPAARQIYLIDKPGAAQSQIRIGTLGVARSTPDYFAIEVMNTILGGSFTSRLNQNLRERNGYTYGAFSGFTMRRAAGPFLASAAVQSDKTVEALREFFTELAGIRQPVEPGELTRARNFLALGFPAAFETTGGMAGNLSELAIYGLPESFFNEYVARIQAVSIEDVERVARQYLPVERFTVVVVGDLAHIESPIRAANLGPVQVIGPGDALE